MAIDPIGFERRGFEVEAVQITAENFADAAVWCSGKIERIRRAPGKSDTMYIRVAVERPAYQQITRAYLGDWIVRGSTTSFKVYRDAAFNNTFKPIERDVHEAVLVLVYRAMTHAVSNYDKGMEGLTLSAEETVAEILALI